MEYFELNNGRKIPALGIGVYTLTPDEAENSVYEALKIGYRHIDTANFYMNERAVARGIKKSGIARSEIFLTSKIWPSSYKKAKTAIDDTLKRLDTDYLDLFLLHQPYGDIKSAWVELEKAVEDGKIRSIGISNFNKKQVENLLSYAKIKPVLVQSECHPYHALKDEKENLKKEGIALESWFPLGHGDKKLINEPIFNALSEKYKKSNVQIILRWHIQSGNIVIPGSKDVAHIKSNFEVFDFNLTEEEMKEIDKLDGRKKYSILPPFLMSAFSKMYKRDFNKQK